MQNYSQTPIFSDVADVYHYPAFASNRNKNISIATAFSTAKAYITIQPTHYFIFTHFAAMCDRYDNAGGVFASASSAAVIGQAKVPNNFLVEIQRGSANNYANTLLTQSEVCSSGQLSGKQVLYGPSQTFSFTFTDLTGLFLLTQANAAVPLTIQFWMCGYTLETSKDGMNDTNFQRLLEYFPGLRAAYRNPRLPIPSRSR